MGAVAAAVVLWLLLDPKSEAQQALDALRSKILGRGPMPWRKGTLYHKGHRVQYEGATYIWTGEAPTHRPPWIRWQRREDRPAWVSHNSVSGYSRELGWVEEKS